MSGMEMMLKSFGLDPKQIQVALNGTVQAIQTFDVRLRNIENALLLLARQNGERLAAIEQAVQCGINRDDDNGNASGGNAGCNSTSGNGNGCGGNTSGGIDCTSGSGGSGS